MDFLKYPSLKRFGTTEVEGLEYGVCHVFPKLDGTNASIWVDENGVIQAGSRNRTLGITSETDNAGFCKFAVSDSRLLRFFNEYSELRLYGEWLVPHSIKEYREDAWRKFYIFDVFNDSTQKFLTYDDYKPLLEKYELDYVPCLFTITNPTVDKLIEKLPSNTYLMKDGSGAGEGIVVKNYNWSGKFDRITWAKLVTNEFREKHSREMGVSNIEVKASVEEMIIEEFCTEAFIEKEFSKMTLNEGWSSKRIGELFGRVWHEFVLEETVNFVKKHKNPTVNFKVLNNLLIMKVKKVKSNIF